MKLKVELLKMTIQLQLVEVVLNQAVCKEELEARLEVKVVYKLEIKLANKKKKVDVVDLILEIKK
jgi:hypothetical protein